MRITFVFADGVINDREDEEMFKLKLDEAIKNVDDIFAIDQVDDMEWKSQFHRKCGNGDGWSHSHWVIAKSKLSPLGAKKLGRAYVPEQLYTEYFKWYFNSWIMAKKIIEII